MTTISSVDPDQLADDIASTYRDVVDGTGSDPDFHTGRAPPKRSTTRSTSDRDGPGGEPFAASATTSVCPPGRRRACAAMERVGDGRPPPPWRRVELDPRGLDITPEQPRG